MKNDFRLYIEDSFKKNIVSTIKTKVKQGNHFLVNFESTVFYPGGGGQPADKGTVDGKEVLSVEEHEGLIFLKLSSDPGAGPCLLEIDFERRFNFMQQHTAQHLISQVLLKKFGAATLSFSLTEKHASIEIDRKYFSDSEITELENNCNRMVLENLEIRNHQAFKAEEMPLRKPPKVNGPIRVIEIDSFDYSPCGGTHLKSTGQIGLIKIIAIERIRGHARLYFLAGWRALQDYQRLAQLSSVIQQILSVTRDQFVAATQRLKEERERLLKENIELKSSLLNREIEQSQLAGCCFFSREFSGLEAAEIKKMALKALPLGIGVCLYVLKPKAYLIVVDGSGLHDLGVLSANLFSLICGRGCARKQIVESSIGKPSHLPKALEMLNELFSTA